MQHPTPTHPLTPVLAVCCPSVNDHQVHIVSENGELLSQKDGPIAILHIAILFLPKHVYKMSISVTVISQN